MLTESVEGGTMHAMSVQKQTVRLSIIKALYGSMVHVAHICVGILDDDGRERLTVGLDLDAKAFSDFALQGTVQDEAIVFDRSILAPCPNAAGGALRTSCVDGRAGNAACARCKGTTFARVGDPQKQPVRLKLAKPKYSNADRRAHLTLEILDADGRPRMTVSADLDADRYSKLMLWEAVHMSADVVDRTLLEPCPGDGAFYSVGCVDGRIGGAPCLRCKGTSFARTAREACSAEHGVPFAMNHGGHC